MKGTLAALFALTLGMLPAPGAVRALETAP